MDLFAQNINDVKTKYWAVSFQVWRYNSFSQQKMSYPIKAGYPVVLSQGLALNIDYHFQQGSIYHLLSFYSTLPTGLTSDDGTGQNYLLASNHLSFYKTKLDYSQQHHLFSKGKINAMYGFSAGLFYEYRVLKYTSGTGEKTNDINLYLGPNLNIKYNLNQKWRLSGGFDTHFYLPYLNYGMLTSFSATNKRIYSSPYRAFYYQTHFSIGIRYLISNNIGMHLILNKDDMTGFGNKKPGFSLKNIIHYKFDRIYALSLGIDF